MSPRKYDMGKRAAATARTRARIVDATLALHTEQGVEATSWDDIARRAGVGVGTVYRHFPSLDELLPACGAIAFELLGLPDPAEAGTLFEGLEGRDRLRRLVDEVYGIYERGGPIVYELERVRGLHPNLAERHEEVRASVDALVREGAGPPEGGGDELRAVRALLDVRTWMAFERQGLSSDAARKAAAEAIAACLGRGPETETAERSGTGSRT
jgi:AcrR family transcriptional regulator